MKTSRLLAVLMMVSSIAAISVLASGGEDMSAEPLKEIRIDVDGDTTTIDFKKELVIDGKDIKIDSRAVKESGMVTGFEFRREAKADDGSLCSVELKASTGDDGVISVDFKKVNTDALGVTTTKDISKEFTDPMMAHDFIKEKLHGLVPEKLVKLIHHGKMM